ncbi:MAG: hypothetical protein U1D30_12525 [Planctomycetota bacterium]
MTSFRVSKWFLPWYGCVALSLGLLAACPTAHALELTFTNNTGLSNNDVYIWFQNPLNATFHGTGHHVQSAKSYSLAEIGAGIDLTSFVGGRVFVSLGAPFPEQTDNARPPQFNNPSPPAVNNSYNNNHQLIGEITLIPSPGDTANISEIDWSSTPVAMRTFDAQGNQLRRIGFADDLNVTEYKNALRALTNGGAVILSGTNVAGNPPTATSQTGGSTVHPQNPSPGSEVRILSPTSNFILEQNGKQTYPSFASYVEHIRATHTAGSPIATLEGRFFSGSAPTYHFTVDSIEAPGASDPSWSLGKVTLTGTLSDSGTVHTIVIPFESFSDVTIYGGTTGSPVNQGHSTEKGIGYYLDGVLTDGGANTAFTLPVRDFLAGLNYGYIASTVANPNDPGKTYGQSASQYWGSTNLVTNHSQILKAFSAVQPLHPYYNPWAAIVHEYSHAMAYGFAYDDVFSKVGLGVVQEQGTPVARLDIVLFPQQTVPNASIPEVNSVLLLSAAAFGFLYLGRKRRM